MSFYITPNEIDHSLSKISDGVIEIITYANKSNFYFPYLLKSSNKFNYPLKILGWETEWKGYCTKFTKEYEYLKTFENKEKYVLFVDAWDVIFVKDYNELVNQVLQLDYDLIVSSNVINYEDQKKDYLRYIQNYGTQKTFGSDNLYNTVNSGVYIIKINKFMDMVDKMMVNDGMDDQEILTKYIIENQDNLKYIVDHGKYFFSTIIITMDLDKVLNNTNSFVIHAPSSSSLDEFIRSIYPNINEDELKMMKPNQEKQMLSRFPYYSTMFVKNNILEIGLLCLVIFLFFRKFLKYLKQLVYF